MRDERRRARVRGWFASACACVCALAVLAGCGSARSAKQRYETAMIAIGKSFGTDLGDVSKATGERAVVTALTKLQDELHAMHAELAKIAPPARVKADQARLVVAVGLFERELGPAIAKLRRGDTSALASFSDLAGLREIEDAVVAIGKAGYDIE